MNTIARLVVIATLFHAFTMAKSNPVPSVNQPLSPDAAKPGGPAFTLTVQGAGFVSKSMVQWNGTARQTHFVNSTTLKAKILISDIANAGTASVTVSNPAPGGGVSDAQYFQIIKPAKSVSFKSSTLITGQEPYQLASGDFNGDGKLDLAVANVTGGTVSIMKGKGDGTFQKQTQYPAGYGPIAVAVGDFNEDGKLDLVVVNNGNRSNGHPGTVTMLLGNGKGAFRKGKTFSCGTGPFFIVTGDFNRDGNLDVAVADYNVSFGNSVAVLLGKGDGTFQPYAAYNVGSAPISLATEDLNGDGILDLVTANELSASVSVLLGNGDGTFQPHMDYQVVRNPISVAVGDLNGDKKPDLGVVSATDNTLSVLLGNGDGTFQPHADSPAGSAPVSIAIADFNADNRQDIAIVNSTNPGAVSILLGKGDGTFKGPVSFPADVFPQGLALGDFNGDGRLDLSTADVFSNLVSVMLQNGK